MNTDPSRFDRVLADARYETLPQQPILPPDTQVGVAAMAGPFLVSMFGMVFLAIAIGLLLEIRPPLAFTILLVGGGLLLVFGGLDSVATVMQFRNAPIEREVCVIVKERTDVSGGGEGRSTSTTYYTTLQRRDGERIECRTVRSLVGKLVVGDIGVAYVKASVLVEFVRFDVA
ncbi:MAG TPA: hypothetical protein VFQ53_40500 [Kofleriaceae bacterium]|nr:hypothetical protein [Kofleriaceae bacterium]